MVTQPALKTVDELCLMSFSNFLLLLFNKICKCQKQQAVHEAYNLLYGSEARYAVYMSTTHFICYAGGRFFVCISRLLKVNQVVRNNVTCSNKSLKHRKHQQDLFAGQNQATQQLQAQVCLAWCMVEKKKKIIQ